MTRNFLTRIDQALSNTSATMFIQPLPSYRRGKLPSRRKPRVCFLRGRMPFRTFDRQRRRAAGLRTFAHFAICLGRHHLFAERFQVCLWGVSIARYPHLHQQSAWRRRWTKTRCMRWRYRCRRYTKRSFACALFLGSCKASRIEVSGVFARSHPRVPQIWCSGKVISKVMPLNHNQLQVQADRPPAPIGVWCLQSLL